MFIDASHAKLYTALSRLIRQYSPGAPIGFAILLFKASKRGIPMVITTQPPPITQSQHQNPQSYQTQMPRFIEKQQQSYEGGYVPQQAEVVEPGFSAIMFNALWPTAGWCLVLFNLAIMISVLFSTSSSYNFYAHGLASFIAVSTLAAMAMIYKWILMAPDGLPSRQHQTPPQS